MIIITLDWSQPWQFLESLSRWLAFIEQSPLCTAVEKPAQVERQERGKHSFS
jgi:hypothetical protein